MKTFTVHGWNAKGTKRFKQNVKAKDVRDAAARAVRGRGRNLHLEAGLDVEEVSRTRKTSSRPKSKKATFIAYLKNTLIPDLRASGHDHTADDFETCLKYMRGSR